MTKHFYKSSEVSFKPATLVDLLRYRTSLHPERTAFTFLLNGETETAQISYGELEQKSRNIAAQLQLSGISGERALLLYPPGLDYIAAFFGCLYAGVVAVPAYPPRPNQSLVRLQAIAADAQATIALTTTTVLDNVKRGLAQSPDLQALRWLATDRTNDLAQAWQEPALFRDTLAFLQYTSGSTGIPKGVMVSHSNLLHNERLIQGAFKLTEQSTVVGWLPLFHDMGLIGNILQSISLGIPCILMSPVAFLQRPWRWLQAISRYKATISGGPNFAYDLCVSRITHEQRATLDLSSWEVAFNGAEPVRAETLERFAAAFTSCGFRASAFYPCYGMAETTLLVSGDRQAALPVLKTFQGEALEQNQVVLACKDDGARTLVGCGQTLLDQQIVIAHPDTLNRCSPNEVGEIWVSGPSVAQGYWNRSEETQKTFQAYLADTGEGPFLRTGDLGFLQDGELFVTGRLKDLIIIRGRNHYPQDIELTVEQSHPALRPSGGATFSVDVLEQLVIVQELERQYLRQVDMDAVIRSISQAVVEQHELEVYAILLLKPGSIPKTSSGKIQRRACRAGFLAGSLDVVRDWRQQRSLLARNSDSKQASAKNESQQTQTIQAWLVSRISHLLGIKPLDVDIRKTFAYYGLGSLEAVSLSADLEDWLGCRLDPTLAYDYPTIEALAQHLTQGSDGLKVETPFTSLHSQRTKEPIAIIGIGCRFPGAQSPEAFWQLLQGGIDAVIEVPKERWDTGTFYDPNPAGPGKMNTHLGGFLEQVDGFDTHFFGISRHEAERMDPQQRLLLEVTWEALENAGIEPDQLSSSQTGVFIGISSNDYSRLQLHNPASLDAYAITGNAHSIAANRLSYLLDLQGPSLAVDTACSSSLVAIHLACQSLRTGESDMALVGGVNLILSPELNVGFKRAGIMATDGRSKTFDASADGFVRSEGCGMVVLKPLSHALRDGDKIMALIRGSATNQDGHSNGLTAPNGLSQQRVIRQALKNADLAPAQISYVEAHGTGTALGDPIEVNALKTVLMQDRTPNHSCAIGSVKTNIGHLEAAAGIAGLIKVVLSLQHKEIPPNLHLQTLNPHISLAGTPLSIPTARQPWSVGTERRFAGVSSFGFGGTNAHVVLEEAPLSEHWSNLYPTKGQSSQLPTYPWQRERCWLVGL